MKKSCANMPEHSRSSSRARPAERRSRRSRAINEWRLLTLFASTALLLFPHWAFAATPTPSPHPTSTAQARRPARVDITKIQPKSLLPKHAEHTEFVVEINKLGQVARIRSERGSDNRTFNAQTYGNALQAFIRTPDGHVVLGTYRLTYDFDPKTARVKRDVTLVRQGGVDPNAKGAALDLMDKANPHSAAPNGAPDGGGSLDPRTLPDLKGIMEPTPTPAPSP